MKNNCYFRDPVNMELVNLDEEITVLSVQKRKTDKINEENSLSTTNTVMAQTFVFQ